MFQQMIEVQRPLNKGFFFSKSLRRLDGMAKFDGWLCRYGI